MCLRQFVVATDGEQDRERILKEESTDEGSLH